MLPRGSNLWTMHQAGYTGPMETEANNAEAKPGGAAPQDQQDTELRSLYEQAFVLSDRDARAAKDMADTIYRMAEERGSFYWQALSRYLAGFCTYNLSEYDSAMQEFEHGQRIAREHGLQNLVVKFHNGYGAIYDRLGRYDQAVAEFAEGLKGAREMGLTSDVAHFLVNIGEASLLMGDAAQALALETQAEAMIAQLPDEQRFPIDVYYNLAQAQARNGLMEEAERSYRRSLDVATSCGNAISEVEARVCLAAILADRGQQEEGLAVTYEALRLSRTCGFALQEVACLLECGRIEQAMGHLDDATTHFEQAVEVAESHHMGDLLPPALESLSSARAAAGRFEEAYQFLLKSVTTARAWSSSEAARKLAELATGYRLEKVQHEAEMERIRREGLESAVERLRLVTRIGRSLTQSLEPRDILMRMWRELSAAIDLTWLGIGVYSPDSGIIEFPGLIEAGVMQQASSVFVNDEFSLASLCVREKRVLSYETAADARAAVHATKLITFEHAPATVETIMYFPLFREDEVVGVLTVQSERPHAYSSDVVELLEAVASFTAIAVENARIMIRLNELNQTISGEKEQVEREALASSWLADHDSLTGLSNRRVLERILEESIKTAQLAGSRLVVFFVDMDDFKDVNDTWGHDAGDRALVEVSRRLVSVFREADHIARVGGDEFVVVAPGLRKEGSIEQMARKLVGAFGQPIMIAEGAIPLSVSVGVAVFPEDGMTSRELISHADSAMYAIKRTGKGAWRMWHGSVEQTL